MSPVFPFSHISYVYKFQGITRGCCSSSAFGEPADAYSNVFSATTVVLDVGILGPVISQRSLTSRLKKNT